MWSVLINFLLAAVQKPLIDAGKLNAQGFNGTDGCGGVFFVSGAGNYVSASVSLAFAIYFLISEKKLPSGYVLRCCSQHYGRFYFLTQSK